MSLKAGKDGFELKGIDNTVEWCTAIKSGTKESGKGIQFRGPGYAYKCSVFGSSGEGFQIQEGVSGVTIERCLVINNAQDGIEIEKDATGNSIMRNIVFSNGDGIAFFDLFDGNVDCDSNEWKKNKFRSSNSDCIE
jgi:parallel beta-helix repeat protein